MGASFNVGPASPGRGAGSIILATRAGGPEGLRDGSGRMRTWRAWY